MNPHRQTPRLLTASRRSQAGITLVETTVVSSVLAVLTGLAAPSFDSSIQRRHLEGAATQLETDIHHARMLAVARNAPLRMSFESGAGGSCYVIHTGAANQCTCAADGSPVCQGEARGGARGALRAGWPGRPEVELALGTVRPDQGHQLTDRHRAAASTQRQRHPPGDEHHGARALMLAGTGAQRLPPLLMGCGGAAPTPGDRRRVAPDGRRGAPWCTAPMRPDNS